MANLDVGVDAKLWLKFVTHNKSVSGYFTSHGQNRDEGIRLLVFKTLRWMTMWLGIISMYSVLAVYCSVSGWHVYWSPGACTSTAQTSSPHNHKRAPWSWLWQITDDDPRLSRFKSCRKKVGLRTRVERYSCIISPGSDRGFNWQTSDKEVAINFPHPAFPFIDTEGCLTETQFFFSFRVWL